VHVQQVRAEIAHEIIHLVLDEAADGQPGLLLGLLTRQLARTVPAHAPFPLRRWQLDEHRQLLDALGHHGLAQGIQEKEAMRTMPSKVLKHNKSMRERRVMGAWVEVKGNKQLPDGNLFRKANGRRYRADARQAPPAYVLINLCGRSGQGFLGRLFRRQAS
jgi:hypothetical protein